MKDAFAELVDRTIEQKLSEQKVVFSVPANVIENTTGIYYKVKVLSDGTQYTLPNFSGSELSEHESVRVYYTGNSLTSSNAYIGASVTKSQGSGGGKINVIKGVPNLGEIMPLSRNFSLISFAALQDTNVFLNLNVCVRGTVSSEYSFEIYLDGEKIAYEPKSFVSLNEYSHINFQIPFEVLAGRHIVDIKTSGGGNIYAADCSVWGQNIEFRYDPTSADDYRYQIVNGVVEIIGYLGNSQNPELPTHIENTPVKILHKTAFNYSNVLNVYIPEGIELIM